MSKTILISGAAGFLSHHLIKAAQDGKWFVIGVDKRPIPEGHTKPNKFIQTDVFDLNYRDLMGVDAVVQMAWRTNIGDCIRHPEESTKDNINMTLHLLEVCKEAKIKKFIFPSTASLYSHNKIPWTEDMVSEPIEHYSWQKLACENLCQMYSKYFDVPTVILRFFQVYGEHQREDTVIAVFKKLIKEGKAITLTKTKEGNKSKSGQRDFIYAGDLSQAVMKAIKSNNVGNGEMINICTGHLHSIEEIAKVMGGNINWIPTRPYDVDIHLGDNKKARLLLGWKPNHEVITWLKNIINK